MDKISKSPDRNTFQKNAYLERCAKEGKEPNPAYLKMWDDANEYDRKWEEEQHEADLEYDLRSTSWILHKARTREAYAQNIYAALCNMRWQRIDVMPLLKDEYWSCSWRSAGGVVADMLGKGDYIDWYCSGIRNREDDHVDNGFVPEGVVTDEIREDFGAIGWQPSPWPKDE
jgi:hypothetical protein